MPRRDGGSGAPSGRAEHLPWDAREAFDLAEGVDTIFQAGFRPSTFLFRLHPQPFSGFGDDLGEMRLTQTNSLNEF